MRTAVRRRVGARSADAPPDHARIAPPAHRATGDEWTDRDTPNAGTTEPTTDGTPTPDTTEPTTHGTHTSGTTRPATHDTPTPHTTGPATHDTPTPGTAEWAGDDLPAESATAPALVPMRQAGRARQLWTARRKRGIGPADPGRTAGGATSDPAAAQANADSRGEQPHDVHRATAASARVINGRVLPSNWRTQVPVRAGIATWATTWADKHPLVGELAAEARAGQFRTLLWQRPRTAAEELWRRGPSRERVRQVLIERRVLIAGVAAVAVFVAADGQTGDTPTDRPLALGEAQHVAIAYIPQLPPNPQSSKRLLAAIAAGEKRREAKVVAAAARATLERAKAEAAAAASGEWQDWMGPRAPVVPGVLVPGSTPSGGGFALPAKGAFTSGFGQRWGTMHRGIDIAAPIGSPIYAVADGTVVEAGPAQGFGLWVRIRHDDGTISIYGHMYDFFVSQGERVPAGMQIARIGNRGDSTGPHLHFEIVQNGQHVDPAAWLALHGLRLT
ncbi:M23 family metallopeptidase [Nocardia rhizosphaerae]|uniref:M23 family metallopeptidase n=1 Tax=Nocardia rhizosphaerae TaxID=1691571 RepID=A0ABV8L1Q5_9NOCA